MDEYDVKSVSEFIQVIEEIKKRTPDNNTLFFRGQSDSIWKLNSSIERQRLVDYEKNISVDIRLQKPTLFKDNTLPVQNLVTMQHYGIPTRLLDFTKNALVALYFSCNENINIDGSVYITSINYKYIKDTFDPLVNAISDMDYISFDNYSGNTKISYMHLLSGECNFNSYKKYLNDKQYWIYKYDEDTIQDFVLQTIKPFFFIPEQYNERIIRQQGCFLIFPNKLYHEGKEFIFKNYVSTLKKENYDNEGTEDYVNNLVYKKELCKINQNDYAKIIIKSSSKKKIKSDLANLGITEGFLFPEINNISQDIINKFQTIKKCDYEDLLDFKTKNSTN
ncbi:MAG: FRG domain-containing protein [Anaerofustis sp.]